MNHVNTSPLGRELAHTMPNVSAASRLGYQAKPIDASEAVRQALVGEVPKPMLRIPYEQEGLDGLPRLDSISESMQLASAVSAFRANMPASPVQDAQHATKVLDLHA